MFFAKINEQGRVIATFMGSGVSPDGLVEINEHEYDRIRSGGVFIFSNGAISDSADDPIPIHELVAQNWHAIKYERDRRTETGGYMVGDKWFHSDQKSRSQQLGLVLLGANIPANLQWKTMDGSFVAMNSTLAQQILGAAAASDQAIFTAAEIHKAALESSADPSAYDFSGGWPKVFGEL